MLNTTSFEGSFALAVSSSFNVNSMSTRQEAWNAYYDLMLANPVFIDTMPESEEVVLTMKSVFHNVDWVN